MPSEVEMASNRDPRCPVVLLLDTSSSMGGKPIEELNKGLKIFEQELKKDHYASLRVQIAVVTFGPVQMRQDFGDARNWQAEEYTAQGVTPTAQALNYALDMIREVKDFYQSQGDLKYYRPWIVLITDGSPTDDNGYSSDNWKPVAQRLKQVHDAKGVVFFAIGVEGANMDVLKQITPDPQFPPVKLNGYEFAKMFQWLSNSLGGVSRSQPGSGQQIPISPPTAWGSISA